MTNGVVKHNPIVSYSPAKSDDDDMEMDISDSDEYDEDELNKSTALLPGQVDDENEPLWKTHLSSHQTPEEWFLNFEKFLFFFVFFHT